MGELGEWLGFGFWLAYPVGKELARDRVRVRVRVRARDRARDRVGAGVRLKG